MERGTIIVIGAAGLIGKFYSKVLSENDYFIIMADSNYEAVVEASRDLNAIACFVDISSIESIQNLIKVALNKRGEISVVLNCAYPKSKNYGKDLFSTSYEDFCESLSLHLGGYFLVMQQFAKYFLIKDGGNFINLSSIYGSFIPRFDIYADNEISMPAEYAAIKSGIDRLTKYFAKLFKKDGIRFNSISPGGVFANQNPNFVKNYNTHCGRVGMLEESHLVSALFYLISPDSKAVTGQNIIVDDGFTL